MIACHQQDGSSLIGILIGAAIGGILLLALSQFLGQSVEQIQVMRDANDRRELRNFMNLVVDCAKTKSVAPTCAGNTVALLDKHGMPVVSQGGTAFGKWTIRGHCNVGNLVVEIKSNKRGVFEPLFKKIPFSCAY